MQYGCNATVWMVVLIIGICVIAYSVFQMKAPPTTPTKEAFATFTSADKTQWRERIIMVFTYMLFRGFALMDPSEPTIQTILDETNGEMYLTNLMSFLLDRDGVLYVVENLWESTRKWVADFPYGTEPLTYTSIEQFLRDHPMFSGDKWEQTFTKLIPSLDSIGSLYLSTVQTETLMKQTIVPTNVTLVPLWKKRVRYLMCALERSTSFDSFRFALLNYGFEYKHTLYNNNPYLYQRIYNFYKTYSVATALTYIENYCFIYYQLERLVSQSADETGALSDSYFKGLDALPENCQGGPPPMELGDGIGIGSGSGSGSGGSGSVWSEGGGIKDTGIKIIDISAPMTLSPPELLSGERPVLQHLIPIPPLRTVEKPIVKVPKIVPGLPSDAVPFTPLDTKSERTLFRWIMWILIAIGVMLWVVFIYAMYIYTPSVMEFQPVVVPAPAPAPASASTA